MPFVVHGMIYGLHTQVTHINDASMEPYEGREWAVQQVIASSGDHSVDSLTAMFVSVGMNHQGVHHMFPTVHWVHYPALSKIIRTAMDRPVKHRTWIDSFGAYLEHLRALNDGP